ncbi:MAG TPA: DUF1761 domain-containing protein [Bryobacteraceae bacterium]|jgi:hypothetical protein|nr:DUF1761 domain-containing protein [Bryobacteraceae bacterium]
MREIHFHFVPMLIATVAKMALGALWYSNALFFKPWTRMSGITEDQVKQGLPKALVADLIGSFLMALALYHTIRWAEAHALLEGLFIGFLSWLGFVAFVSISVVTYERKPVKLYLLNAGYQLVSMLVMAAILTVWG